MHHTDSKVSDPSFHPHPTSKANVHLNPKERVTLIKTLLKTLTRLLRSFKIKIKIKIKIEVKDRSKTPPPSVAETLSLW